MSLREKGNQQFKNNNIHKAIQYYLQYVQQDNKDNQLAYSNLAMCYFKLKDYPKTIQACENALAEKKDYFKAYYRLYLTYMEIPNQQYKVFINAALFLKYLNDQNTSARTDAMKIVRDYREKFVAKKNEKSVNIEGSIIDDLEKIRLETFDIGKEKHANTIEEWQQYFLDEKVHFVQKCQGISKIAETQSYEEAINLAYFLSNISSKQSEKTYVKQMIAKLKTEQSEKLKQNEVEEERQQVVIANQQQSDQTEENLFASESEPVHKEKEQVQQANQQEQSKQIQQVNQQPVKHESPETFQVNSPSQLHSQESIDEKIKEFLESTRKSRDLFKDLKDNICKLLESNQQVKKKKLYLTKLHEKCREVNLIKSSFGVSQQQEIYKLLTLNDLSQLCPIYAPKCK